MKRLILFICLVALFQPGFCNETAKDSKSISSTEKTAKNSVKIGYFVYVQKCGKVAKIKTQSLPEAEKFIRSFYPDFCANIEYIFAKSPYYMETCFQRKIYIEKMIISKKCKYKRIKIEKL